MPEHMTIAAYYRWFHREWMRAGLVVGIFLIVYLTVLIAPNNLVLYAMLLCTPLYMFHETEEYMFPGGFAQFLNQYIYREDPESGMLDQAGIFWMNMAIIWFLLTACGLLAVVDLRWAAWMPYFFIFQAVVHVGLGIRAKRWYNPGLATAWLLHVPFAIWAILLLQSAGVVQDVWFNLYLVIGFLANVVLIGGSGIILMRRYKHRPA